MTSTRDRRTTDWGSWLALGVIVAIAAGLRFSALEFGGPAIPVRPDEEGLPVTLAAMARGQLFPPLAVYGGGFFYPLYGAVALARAFGFVATDPAGPDAVFAVLVVARAWSALLATATVVFVYAIARRLYDRRAGLLAALVLAVATLPVREAHFAKADSAATLAVAVFLLCLVVPWRSDRRRAIAVGLATALALGTKASIEVLPAAGLALVGAGPSDWRRAKPGIVAIGIATGAVCFVALNVFWLTHPREAWTAWVASFASLSALDWFPGRIEPPSALPYHAQVSFGIGIGSLTALAAVPGVGWALYRGGAGRLVAVACLGQLAKLVSTPMVLARYALPAAPALVVLAAVAIVAAVDRLPVGRAVRAALLALIAVLLAAAPARNSVALVRLLGRPDTRALAGAWIRDHVPADAVLVSVGSPRRASVDWGRPPVGGRRVLRDVPMDGWRAAGATWLVRHAYPLEYSGEPLPDGFRGRRRAVFDPFTGAAAVPILEPLDAFYLPIGGLDAVERPGPRIEIYELE